ncbi:DUF262 domain-containing HNH endonuclease family protein [Candidatus Woesearchaeota archaeon]|jgi:uncharacterized protein with ParB-like and HNH nuclease domain|nr:DUF262 domain-containing HNH endonuclease family protein [Candidatus Woesearchaeota archaeon]
MTKDIEPKLKLISQYLILEKSQYFVIPEYQRSYSWGIAHCDKLWQDIEAFISSDASDPYFFGTIIVDCSDPDHNKFNLIDGQQRTTTFLLLLKALLIRLNDVIKKIPKDEDSEALKAGLEANRNKIMTILYKAEAEDIPIMLKDDTKTKNKLIIENKSINELYLDEIKKIIEAIDFDTAEQKVHKIPRKQKDNKYTNHFRNFKYFYGRLMNKSDSQLNEFAKVFLNKCQVIEIRSWQIEQAITMFNSLNSTGLPLADADIISAQLYSKAGTDKNEFNEQWKLINKLVDELNTRKIIDIDSVLQQFMYINRAINKEYVKDNSVDVTTPGLRRYYIDIKKELLSKPLVLCANFDKITKTWDKIKNYPVVKLLLKYNENAKLYLSSYLYRYKTTDITEAEVMEICEPLLRLFTILELVDSGYSSAKFKTFLFGENIKLVDNNISIEIIKKDFNEHINKNWNEKDISESIIAYEKNILVYINEYLYNKNKFNFEENVNIEHIMPSSGRNITTIQTDAGIENKEDFNSIVNKLGNKILLEEDINKSIGREWFKTKKQNSIKDKSGYKDSRYTIARALTKYPKDTWTKEDIDKATNKAVERIVKFIFNK